jgi:hypothetical protein
MHVQPQNFHPPRPIDDEQNWPIASYSSNDRVFPHAMSDAVPETPPEHSDLPHVSGYTVLPNPKTTITSPTLDLSQV